MRVRVLGSGAGGGFPQWNCNCPNCAGLRAGRIRAEPRTQDSIACSADGVRWYVLNASPDLRMQIERFPLLHPRKAPRDTPIQAILLTNADIDHVAGLLSLREAQPLCVYSTEAVRCWVRGANVLFRAISRPPSPCTWKTVRCGAPEALVGVDGEDSGLRFEAFAVPGKPPAYLAGVAADDPENTVGYKVSDARSGRSFAYVPGAKGLDPDLVERLGDCDCLFFDGTFWSEDELERLGIAGVSGSTATAMGHLPIGGPDGSLAALSGLRRVRKIFTHINNTNPILVEGSPERRAVEDAGWEVAFDGMDLEI